MQQAPVGHYTRLPSHHAISPKFLTDPPAEPREVTAHYETLELNGHTLSSPHSSGSDLCSFTLARQFGDRIAVHCCRENEPSDAAMALLWKFGGSAHLTMISKTRPAHTLKYIPEALKFEHAHTMKAADSTFLLDPNHADLARLAIRSPQGATAVLITGSSQKATRMVAELASKRPDLQVIACTGALPQQEADIAVNAAGLNAFSRVSALRTGGTAFLARPISLRDAMWLSEQTGHPCRSGMVLFAPFAQHGIDRALFKQWQSRYPARVSESLSNATYAQPDLVAQRLHDSVATGDAQHLKSFRRAIRQLGDTAVYGSTGHIGSAITEALGGKVNVYAMSRRPVTATANSLASPRHPVISATTLPSDATVKSAFVAASVPWKRDPQTGRVIFDRSALLQDNLREVMVPMLKELPGSTSVLQIITNPSSDLAYAAWLLRPDLAQKGAISAHVGTDVTRQRAHVKEADQPDTWFTLGPHSPTQVNVDLAAGCIDPRIAVMGKTLNDEAGDRSVIDPTAMASVVEACELLSHKPGSYGLPLSAEEAHKLSMFMTLTAREPVAVSEGIAITLPRDAKRNIRWDMLHQACEIPGFAVGARLAIEEMENGRWAVIDGVLQQIKTRNPQARLPTREDRESWVLRNRQRLLDWL